MIFFFLCKKIKLGQQQQNRGNTGGGVNSKLDFEETDNNNNNSSVPIIPGLGRGRTTDGQHHSNRDGNDENGEGGVHAKGKSGPKIHGVRVTVDTGDSKNSKGIF